MHCNSHELPFKCIVLTKQKTATVVCIGPRDVSLCFINGFCHFQNSDGSVYFVITHCFVSSSTLYIHL